MDGERPLPVSEIIRLHSPPGGTSGTARAEFPKACKFATDDAITASYFRHKVVEVYRGGEIIEI